MSKRLVVITICIVLFLSAAMEMKRSSRHENEAKETFSDAILKYGSAGDDVYELQGRLKFLGYYNGNIDGDFGYQTLQSVKTFQWKFGMDTDGIVGAKTKLMLWKATKDWRPGQVSGTTPTPPSNEGAAKPPTSTNALGLSENDLNIMANAVYGESRGESYIGQVAVAAVILNRVKSSQFPNSVHGVIFQPGAFTAVADGQIYLTPNETAKKAVRDAVNGNDPTDGCLYYFNPATATSAWIWSRPQYKTIGKHIFCR